MNALYNNYMSSKDLLEECNREENVVATGVATMSCLKKKTVKRSVQYHVFVQSPPGRRPNDKYPANTSHRSRFV